MCLCNSLTVALLPKAAQKGSVFGQKRCLMSERHSILNFSGFFSITSLHNTECQTHFSAYKMQSFHHHFSLAFMHYTVYLSIQQTVEFLKGTAQQYRAQGIMAILKGNQNKTLKSLLQYFISFEKCFFSLLSWLQVYINSNIAYRRI